MSEPVGRGWKWKGRGKRMFEGRISEASSILFLFLIEMEREVHCIFLA